MYLCTISFYTMALIQNKNCWPTTFPSQHTDILMQNLIFSKRNKFQRKHCLYDSVVTTNNEGKMQQFIVL